MVNTYAHGEYYMCEIKMEESELLDCYQWFPRFGIFLNYICGPSSHFYFENFQPRFSGHASLEQLKLHPHLFCFPSLNSSQEISSEVKNVSSNCTCREGCSCDYHNTDTEHSAVCDSWTGTVISVSNKQLPVGGASQTPHTLKYRKL